MRLGEPAGEVQPRLEGLTRGKVKLAARRHQRGERSCVREAKAFLGQKPMNKPLRPWVALATSFTLAGCRPKPALAAPLTPLSDVVAEHVS